MLKAVQYFCLISKPRKRENRCDPYHEASKQRRRGIDRRRKFVENDELWHGAAEIVEIVLMHRKGTLRIVNEMQATY